MSRDQLEEWEWRGWMRVDPERADVVITTDNDGTQRRLEPTGRPFDDALEYMGLALDNGCRIDQVKLVHGIVMPHGKQARAHAWVERTDRLDAMGCGAITQSAFIDANTRTFYSMPTSVFITLFNPIHACEYTAEAAMHLNLRHKHRGPWNNAYFYVAALRGLQSRSM